MAPCRGTARLRYSSPGRRRANGGGGGRMETDPAPEACIAATREWLERAVIGLNLCPFAKAPHAKGQVRYVVSDATRAEDLLADLLAELQRLADADPGDIETTLLIHPHVLGDFL